MEKLCPPPKSTTVLKGSKNPVYFIEERGLISTQRNCERCEMRMMREKLESKKSNGYRWRCTNKDCRATLYLRKDTIFSTFHLFFLKNTHYYV